MRVEKLSERADVYCLTVPDGAHFAIEGGIIVHNCDMVRYACNARPYVFEAPREPKQIKPFRGESWLSAGEWPRRKVRYR